MKEKFGVYILKSLRNGRYYVGSTNNVERRMFEHNSGFVTATQSIRPLELKVFIECPTLANSRICEYRLKEYKSSKIVEKVINSKIFPWEYGKIRTHSSIG